MQFYLLIHKTCPITLKASEQVPKNVLMGPNYRIEANVKNDGLINIYRLTTDYGPLKVEGASLLMERTNELKALSHMQEVEQTDTFAEALKKGATAPLRTAKGLVTHPVDTVSGIASGVGNWFRDIGNAITSDDPHQEEPNENLLTNTVSTLTPAMNRFRIN
jgi:hypothetical protein